MVSGRRNSILRHAFWLLLLAASCSQPSGHFTFLSAQQAARQDGTYAFDADFEDSTAVYVVGLAARIVTNRIPDGKLDFDIRITPPDGETSIERVSVSLQEQPGVQYSLGSGAVADWTWEWRSFSMKKLPPGCWHFALQPADPALGKAIHGIGFSYEKNTSSISTMKWAKAN